MEREYEQEIDLLNLLYKIVCGWRKALLMGIVVMILFALYSGYNYIVNVNSPSEELVKAIEAKEKAIEKKNSDIKGIEINNEASLNIINNTKDYLDQQNQYLSNSIRMKIDPYNIAYEKVFYILGFDNSSDSDVSKENVYRDPIDEIIALYLTGLAEKIDYSTLEEKYGTTKLYINELYSIDVDYTSNTIGIKSIGIDESMAKDIMDALVAALSIQGEKIKSENRLIYIIDEMSRNSGTEVDQALVAENTRIFNELRDGSLNISKEELEIKNREPELEKLEKELEGLEKEIEELSSFDVNKVIKYAVIGFIAGTFIYAMCIAIKYIFVGKLRTASDIEAMKQDILGEITNSKDYKGLFSFVDKSIDKLFGHRYSQNEGIVIERLCKTINTISKSDCITLVSTLGDETNFADKIANSLDAKTINSAMEFLATSEALDNVKGDSDCILVEYIDESSIKDISKELLELKRLNKNILGTILIHK